MLKLLVSSVTCGALSGCLAVASDVQNVTGLTAALLPPEVSVVYEDALADGWHDWSFSLATNAQSSSPALGTMAQQVQFGMYSGWKLAHADAGTPVPIAADAYTHVVLHLNPGEQVSPALSTLEFTLDNGSPGVLVSRYATLQPNTWSEVRIPLADVNGQNAPFSLLQLFNADGALLNIDSVSLQADDAPVTPPANTSGAPYDLSGLVTSWGDKEPRPLLAKALHQPLTAADGERPVAVFLPGWGGSGDVGANVSRQAQTFAAAGYITISLGFHQTGSAEPETGQPPVLTPWTSDLAESTLVALDALCKNTALAYCAGVVLVGTSYGGTQAHPVLRYLRSNGYDGANPDRKVVAFLSQDAGYTLTWQTPDYAQLDLYSVAMIQNLGDLTFKCSDGNNCPASDRVAFHLGQGTNTDHLLSYCPAGGGHGTRGYADWDEWVLDAAKTMLHTQQNVPTFPGYDAPAIAVGPNGIAGQGECAPGVVPTTPAMPSAPAAIPR